MKTVLQIICCILACACATAAFFLGAFVGFTACLIAALAAVGFAALMFWLKNSAAKQNQPPKPDFMNDDAENKEINEQRKSEE